MYFRFMDDMTFLGRNRPGEGVDSKWLTREQYRTRAGEVCVYDCCIIGLLLFTLVLLTTAALRIVHSTRTELISCSETRMVGAQSVH